LTPRARRRWSTGAGNGIGRAIAQALVGEGVRTVFADVNADTVTAAVKSSPRPELALPWVGDLANSAARDALLAHAEAAIGRVNALRALSLAAATRGDHAMAVTTETWAHMHAVNLEAGFHLARALARKLIADKSTGSFLLLTSLHAGTPRNLPHYSTAKAGLAMLVRELAKTFGRYGIRVNALGARRHRGGGFRRRPQARPAHSARPSWSGRRSGADGAGGAVEPDFGLRHRAAIVVDGGLSLTNWFEPPELE